MNERCKQGILKFYLREYYYMNQKPKRQQKEKIGKFKSWKCNYFLAILDITKDMIKHINIRSELK